MWSWFIYKVQSPNIAAAIESIDRDAARMKYKKPIHAYSHSIVSVLNYPDRDAISRQPQGYRDNHYSDKPDFWGHQLQTERDIIDLVHRERQNYLFNPLLSQCWARAVVLPNLEIETFDRHVDRIKQQYLTVNDRDTERQFLATVDRQLYPLFLECPPTYTHYWESAAAQWRYLTKNQRWLKRHTSLTSFPFMRPGLDVIKTFEYLDLGGELGKQWYALVSFHY
jgi:hypothetical protein